MSATIAGTETPAAEVAQTFPRLLPFHITVSAALLTGFISEYGAPGSIIAVPLGALLLWLLLHGKRQGARLWRTGMAPAAITSWVAVAIQPSLLALSLHFLCLFSLALTGKGVKLRHAADATAATSIVTSLARTPIALLQDIGLLKINRPSEMRGIANLVLPVFAFGAFATLLMIANPLMEQFVLLRIDHMFEGWMWPATFLTLILVTSINAAGPSRWTPDWERELPASHWHFLLLNPASLKLTLLLLNALFAVQNLLDFNYVWLQGELPSGMTHAEYVHRGSYTLIATAILAALLIVFALRRGSETEASPLVCKLVYLWLAQNVFLVASSAARTLAYVEDYGMSMWRLSGLIWMGVVVAGLGLVALRVVSLRGNEWLTNANLAVCLSVLLGCSLVDLRWVVAEWNAISAIEGSSQALDEVYLRSLGPSAVPALIRLQAAGGDVLPCPVPNASGPFSVTPWPDIRIPLRMQQSRWQTFSLLDAHYENLLDAQLAACALPHPLRLER